ncbi:MAG: NADPH-dependent FMN reductase [SAR202 cluster bacterium]|jgi:chromate reductase|nr:NADPH-dependent FMN reductase [SAR202 cluster bacterium]MDP6302125.1 NADPH-dependent FMN reductase [SAR202 cluster bacterium]MDP7103762.1 NADPH-dependent FMN reductase [SAR202 cluster bacterium]MDP7226236.1 NADPH-dependent FMN reductase [SAR202 cluster bacterium]MDP7412634.1 NADPH-dependent FMN reductase [SAR202 cluster bacterium]|tara:strand:- start:485 stop:1072 length:588 start_codon:yes stop_codon:yes gene_type:complete
MNNNNGRQFNVVGISGSLRAKSSNGALLRAAQELVPASVDISIFDISDIPFYDGDIEKAGDPASVTDLKEAIKASDGVVIVTPEYNHAIPGLLMNTLDWASRDKSSGSMFGKPVTVMGAGGMTGTARAQGQLQTILMAIGGLVMAKPGVLVASPADKFDDQYRLIDEETREFVRAHMTAFKEWMTLVGRPVAVTV